MSVGGPTDVVGSTATAGRTAPRPRRRPSAQAVAEVVLTVLLLALFGWAFLEAAGWSFRTALFPRIVSGAAFVLSALHLVKALLQLVRETRAPAVPDGADPAADPDDSDADDAEHLFRTAGARRWASAVGWVVAFFVLLQVGGLFVTASLFSLLYLRFGGGRTWRFSVAYAVVIGVVLYAAFELALDIPTPPGLFPG
jgi:hypothetical protein